MSTVGQGAGYLVGAIAGSFIPGVGTMLGAQIGGMIGGYLDPPKQKGNKPQSDLSVQTATYGAPFGSGDGNYAKYGNLFWCEGNKLRLETGSSGGGKGGQNKATPDEIYGTFAIGFGEGEIAAFGRIWCNGKLVYDPTAGSLGAKMANGDVAGNLTFYTGSATQLPDPRMQADMGAAYTPAYRGLHYIVFNDWPMADYGNTLMGIQVKAEIINSATVTQYVRHVFSQDQLPDTSTYPGAGSTTYGYFNPRISDGVFRCDISNVTNSYAYTYSIGFEGNLISRETSAYETGAFGYIGQCAAGAVTYDGGYTGTFKVGGADWKLKTSDANNTCHGMAVGGDGRVYALERVAGAWLFNIYDGDSLALVSSGNNSFIQMGDIHISLPCIPGTKVSFCIEPDGVHLWSNQEGGGNWNFLVGEISGGNLVQLHAYTDGYLGASARFACLVAANGICYGVNNHGDFFVYDRMKTLSKTSVSLASIIEKRCLLSGLLSSGDIDTSAITQMVRGYKVDNVGSIRNSLEPLQGARPFDIIPSGYQIKFKPRGASPVATIDITDLGAVSGNEKIGDILTQSREMDTQLPVKVQITYIDVNREYDKGTGPGAWRTNTDAVNVQTIDMAIVLNADEAAGIEETLLYMYWMERAEFNFTLPPIWLALEVADVITINEPGASYELRLTDISYLPDGRMECTAKLNNPALYTWTAKGQDGQSTGQVLTYPGASLLVLLDIPCVDSRYMDKPGMAAAVYGFSANWNGGTLFTSEDSGQTWGAVQDYTAPSGAVGMAINAIGSVAHYTMDHGSVLSVNMVSGNVYGVSLSSLLAGANHFAYGAPGRWEIIAAKDVTTNPDGSLGLFNLLRGRFGTEENMGLHASGDSVIMLDSSSVRFIGLGISALNAARPWRAVTSGRQVATAAETSYAYAGVNLLPLSPVDVKSSIDGTNGNFIVDWTPRTRTPVGLFSGAAMPTGETAVSYRVDIYDATFSTVLRTVFTATEQMVYSMADRNADYGTPVDTIYIKVRQVSSTVGSGFPATKTLHSTLSMVDPYWASVVLALHFEGANNSTTFTDVKGHTITPSGGAKISTAWYAFGASSGLFNGTNSALACGAVAPKNGNFTINFQIRVNVINKLQVVATAYTYPGGVTSGMLMIWFSVDNRIAVWSGGVNVVYGSTFAAGASYHVEIGYRHSDKTVFVFIDGVLVSSGPLSVSITNGSNMWIGGVPGDPDIGTQWLDANLDEFLLTSVLRHTTSFTPPFTEFPEQ